MKRGLALITHTIFREVNKALSKKKKRQKNLKTDEQQEYVDSNRRIAVSFDSKELSRAFKNFNKIHVCLNTLKPQLMRAIYPAHIAGL